MLMVPPQGKIFYKSQNTKKNEKNQQVTGAPLTREIRTIFRGLQVLPPRSGAAGRRGSDRPILPSEHYVLPRR